MHAAPVKRLRRRRKRALKFLCLCVWDPTCGHDDDDDVSSPGARRNIRRRQVEAAELTASEATSRRRSLSASISRSLTIWQFFLILILLFLEFARRSGAERIAVVVVVVVAVGRHRAGHFTCARRIKTKPAPVCEPAARLTGRMLLAGWPLASATERE